MPTQKNLILAIGLVSVTVILLVASLIMLMGARRDERNNDTLARVVRIRSALSLYFLSTNTYPQPAQVPLVLGSPQAQCLNTSPQGFVRSCDSGDSRAIVLAQVPRGILHTSALEYTPSEGDYTIAFTLEGSWGNVRDTNKDGVTQCRATSTTMICQ